jgi:hypothetical protein
MTENYGGDRLPWELPALTMEEAKRLLGGPFGEELHRLAVRHMSYFVFGKKGPRGEPQNLQNGTCFFIKTPMRLLAVTARHVIEGFRRAKESDPSTLCQIGNLLFDPVARLIGVGEKADIATMDVRADELTQIGKAPITLWPPDPPDGDDRGVLLAGFPAAAAIVHDNPRIRGFGIYAATGVAQRVTNWQLSCTVEWENSMPPPPGLGSMPPANYNTGGMSGGPVLSVRERRGILSFPLAAVISEGRSETDIIVAEHADSIRADGTIRT